MREEANRIREFVSNGEPAINDGTLTKEDLEKYKTNLLGYSKVVYAEDGTPDHHYHRREFKRVVDEAPDERIVGCMNIAAVNGVFFPGIVDQFAAVYAVFAKSKRWFPFNVWDNLRIRMRRI